MDNYIDLRFAVSDLVSNRIMSDVFPRLTKAAEATFNRELRTSWQIQDYDLDFDDGVSPLPFDFLEVLHVYNTHDNPMHSGPLSASRRLGSEYTTYEIANGNISIRGLNGTARILQYYAALPTLTSSPLATNWLLQRYPNAYLYGVGYEAAKFLRDPDQAQLIDNLLQREVDAIRIDDERTRWSNSIVRVQGLTP